ncbi:hypothetical protein P8452_63770 [Trifolium repens]|nr:hypothetical protein P8452_63770 [Trifolium repens]
MQHSEKPQEATTTEKSRRRTRIEGYKIIIMVDSVVTFTIERLSDLLIEEANLLSGVSDQIQKLQIELKRMQCFLRDAERKRDEGGAMTPFYKLRHVHKVGNKILSINSQIADLTRSLQTYGLTATTRDNEESHFVFVTQRQLRWSYSHVVEEFIVGRHFECFAWAYISQKCIRREVWEGILLQLTTSPSKEERDEIRNMRDEELAKKLYKVQQEKMCLIILDDIWSNDAWDILSPAFPTKNTKRFLNAEDSWALFQKKAFPTKDDPGFTICNEFEILGRDMVAKCAGLPLAIIVLGEGFISSQYEIERDETMEDVAERYLGRLISRCMVQVGQIGSTGKIKTCRLHDVMRDMCLSKAKEEHFLSVTSRSQQNSNSINDVSSSSNVLLGASKTSGVRRVALFLDQYVDNLIPPNEQVNQHLRSLVYIHDKKCRVESWKLLKAVFESFKLLRVLDLEGVKGSKGQLLPKEVGNLFWLKFLSLKRTYLQILPSSLGKLENLQSLNLQTINKVSWDSTVEIPNIIWKLKRLRHLYLPNWCGNVSGILQLENLINLQTLVNFPASKCDVQDLLKMKKLRKLVLNDPRYFQKFAESFSFSNEKLECLESLSLKTDLLSFPDEVVDAEKLVLGCPSLHKLHIEGRMERLPEAQLFSPQLSKLTLWGCKLVEDPMVTLERLPNLKYLSCWEMFVGKKMVCSPNGFPKLEVLVIRGFSNLEEWVVENQAMSFLYRLSISDCNKLKTVPDGLKFVAGLQFELIKYQSGNM